LRNYFTLTKRELRGTLVLTAILSVQLVILIVNKNFTPDPVPANVAVIDTFDKNVVDRKSNSERSKFKVENLTIHKSFDPNKMQEKDWIKIGLPEKIARTITNYLNHGGSFRRKEDLKKIYGMNQKLYSELEPYILIPEYQLHTKTPSTNSYQRTAVLQEKTYPKIELNIAEQADLEALPQIGIKRAQQILKYRTILGGYYHINQLLEVYSIDSSVFEVIKDRVMVDDKKIIQIRVNISDTIYHPYLSRKQVLRILNYRKSHGSYLNKSDVCTAALLNDKLCAKIAPYLILDTAANQ
jgi:DNA uptake protein ComE-like DNA-binding protein